MTDRARELAEALLKNPWVDPSIRDVCKRMSEQWTQEDKAAALGEGAQKMRTAMTDRPEGPLYSVRLAGADRDLDIVDQLKLMEAGRVTVFPRDQTIRDARETIERLRKVERKAFQDGFWAYAGPANEPEFSRLEKDEQQAWDERKARALEQGAPKDG